MFLNTGRRPSIRGGSLFLLFSIIVGPVAVGAAQPSALDDVNGVSADAPVEPVALAQAAQVDPSLTINGVPAYPLPVRVPENLRESAKAAASSSIAPRRYYLTTDNFSPDQALAACANGYRMASLWEILDPSNLVYAIDHPDAFTRADSGEGPPAGWNGWVRTGLFSSGSNAAGSANCQAWTSASGSDFGTTVKLPTDWTTTPNEIGVWDATAFGCNLTGPVWCIED